MKASAVPTPIARRAASASVGRGSDRSDGVAEREHGEARRTHPHGTEPVAEPARRQLHEHVREEQDGREQPDHREADAVGVGELVRDRADVGDVPAGGEADGAPGGDRTGAHRRAGQEMIAAVTRAPAIGRLY